MQNQITHTTANTPSDSLPLCLEMKEAEELMQEVRRLLVHSEDALKQEDVMQQRAETLERWLESYRRGLAAAQKLSQNSDAFLRDIRERLKLAIEEMQRLEDESTTPATKEQKQRLDELTRALSRVDHLVSALSGASFTPNNSELV